MRGKILFKALFPLIVISFLLFDCSNPKKGEEILKPILEKTPIYHYNLGNKYLNEGKMKLAIAEYKKALELDPNNPEVYNSLGLAYFFDRQYQEAIVALEKVLQLDPGYADAHNNLGMVYNEIGNKEKAVEEFRLALRNPGYINKERPYYNLGNIALSQENYDEAMFCFTKALESAPDWAEAYYRLGIAFEEMGRINEALQSYKQALELQPIMLEANYNIALLYFKLNNDERAKYYFYQVVTLAPETELGQKAAEFIKIINKRMEK